MMLYKFISPEKVERETNPIWIDNKVISNPTESILRSLGYTDMISASVIPDIKKNEYLVPQYVLKDDIIVQTFKVGVISDEFI